MELAIRYYLNIMRHLPINSNCFRREDQVDQWPILRWLRLFVAIIGADLCLKYYRALRYRVRCEMIVVERRCTDCTNKWSSLLKFIYKLFTGGYKCVLFVCVQNCECIVYVATELRMPIQKCDTENPNVYLTNKFQGRLSN